MLQPLTLRDVWDINAAAEVCAVNFTHGTGIFHLAGVSSDLFNEFVRAAKQELTGKPIFAKHLVYLDMALPRGAGSSGSQKVNHEECVAVMMCAGGLEARIDSIDPETLVTAP